jgi:hypothetical protein
MCRLSLEKSAGILDPPASVPAGAVPFPAPPSGPSFHPGSLSTFRPQPIPLSSLDPPPTARPTFTTLQHLPNKQYQLTSNEFTNHPINRNFIVTDLTHSLSEEEKRLLSKGPKFALNRAVNDNTKRDVTVSLCRLANELRWLEHRKRTNASDTSNSEFPKYPYKDEIIQAPKYADFERKLTRVNEVITRCLNSANRREASNLLPSERRTLAQLKKKDLQCLPSDKGGEFCVIERTRYVEIGNQHLSDSNIYSEIASISPKTIESRVNKVWKAVAKKHELGFSVTSRYVSNNTDLAHFYFLIKTHKSGNVPKVRPIVSNVNSPTTKISWLLDKALKPLIQGVKSHLESTNDLLHRLNSLESEVKETYTYPCSLDVVSLYTSIPQQDVVNVTKTIMDNNNYSFHNLNSDDIANLLEVVLDNNYFTFENKTYKQTHGLAMGSSVSAILAILYMGHIEAGVLDSLGARIGFYSRYVDDIFLLTTGRDEAEEIHAEFNNANLNIKFEIEHPRIVSGQTVLQLLDVSVHVSEGGNIHYEFYKKDAKKPLFVNFKSSLPTRSKMNYIRNERKRILNNCSNVRDAEQHLSDFDSVLKINDYPSHFINNYYTHPNTADSHATERRVSENVSYLNFPFITDGINRKIVKCFRKEGLNVRLYHKSYSLRNALKSKRENSKSCSKRGCSLDDRLCFRKNVVYKVTCDKCLATYIGSTIRHLHDRIHEHFNNANSSVKKHFGVCGSSSANMQVEILDHEPRKGSLRIREAFFINKLHPSLNSKEESSIDLILF